MEEPVYDPGRHSLFGTTRADRCLVLGPGGDGCTARLIFSTLSWFDLVSQRRLARPRLEDLARHLNELEGTTSEEEVAWRSQPASNAAPELWFGTADQVSFAEHSNALRPSRLDPDLIEDSLRAGLRPA